MSLELLKSSLEKEDKENTPSVSGRPVEHLLCQHCGGNGYMKSSPNCYHTCLHCLGRGQMKIAS
ncbi:MULTISPECIES: Zn-ribbon protein [Prochlorococcus]|uniref:Zn-ribbon protein n=1 Tax=Prochlorococcus marinus (strain SARG / CCMP1375 / SS120) TaxID=167539 RepID=Q7VC90_PROMA|nr:MULTISPECIES: Zn-ribbon protein [Prochlorococcus]AAP99896.1 Zn-ribbon protein [Prochlorococcus marinus subsp. marinus str. CCMP1375]KGG11757.1 Zn-ribbon protein [Prochlorococcus marinus str. LG]KGG35178.1 Zn-ribbon protein [Prochlorococcus sp. SS52]